MSTSARLREIIIQLLSDQKNHSVQDIKNYLAESNFEEYRPGHLAGSINFLIQDGTIMRIDRGIYSVNQNVGKSVDTAKKSISKEKSNEMPERTKSMDNIFIVHGHDDRALDKVAQFIKSHNLNPIILREQPSGGKTIIEKIEANTDVGFAIVLYTPCDDGKSINESLMKKRARQNVVFEHGFLIGKLGRDNVCAILKGDIEIPSDINGIGYIRMDDKADWEIRLSQEMTSVGMI